MLIYQTLRFLFLASITLCAFAACDFPGGNEKIENQRATLGVSLTRLADTVQAEEGVILPVETLVPGPGTAIVPPSSGELQQTTALQIENAEDFVWLPVHGGMVLALPDGLAAYNPTAGVAPQDLSPGSEAVAPARPALLSVARDQDVLAWVGQEHLVTVWKSLIGQQQIIDETKTPVTGLALSDRGNELAYSTYDGALVIQDLTGGVMTQAWQAPSWLTNMIFSQDGRLLGGIDLANFTAYIFNVESGEIERMLQWRESASPALYGAYFSPNWQSLAWVARGTVQIMDVSNGELGALLSHEDFVSAVAWAPDERLLATAAAGTVNGEFVPLVILWDVTSGRSLHTLVLKAAVQSMAFSPDGRQLAVLNSTGFLQTWILE